MLFFPGEISPGLSRLHGLRRGKPRLYLMGPGQLLIRACGSTRIGFSGFRLAHPQRSV
jgi:hypothetical protein